MKLAVLADIHANLPALQTVTGHIEAWNPDRVIVAGDVINRGPRSPECLAFILEKQATAGWQVLKGNHEDYIIAHTKPDAPQSGPLLDIYRHTIWTLQQLNGDVSAFENWPDTICFAGPDGQEVRVTHASMLGNRRGIFPAMDEAELTRRVGEPEHRARRGRRAR
ncbi:MAG: metallophosphoesterase family protein, partial [Anaerolineales bacterium]